MILTRLLFLLFDVEIEAVGVWVVEARMADLLRRRLRGEISSVVGIGKVMREDWRASRGRGFSAEELEVEGWSTDRDGMSETETWLGSEGPGLPVGTVAPEGLSGRLEPGGLTGASGGSRTMAANSSLALRRSFAMRSSRALMVAPGY